MSTGIVRPIYERLDPVRSLPRALVVAGDLPRERITSATVAAGFEPMLSSLEPSEAFELSRGELAVAVVDVDALGQAAMAFIRALRSGQAKLPVVLVGSSAIAQGVAWATGTRLVHKPIRRRELMRALVLCHEELPLEEADETKFPVD